MIFETERELVVTAAQLVALVVHDPEEDLYADQSALMATPSSAGVPVFQGNRAIDHLLYLGHDMVFGYPTLQQLRLTFASDSALANPEPRVLQWEIWDGVQGVPLAPVDTTVNLTKAGDVVFNNLTQFPSQTVNGVAIRWLRCHLLTPITKATDAQKGMVRPANCR